MEVGNRNVHLYGNAKVNYGDMSLKAGYIEINWANNLMNAKPLIDSSGKAIQIPVFESPEATYVAHHITYNYQTGKGIIKDVVTQQGEGYIHGEVIKKVGDNLYISSADYTTCNLAHPHFSIKATKLKVIPEDKIVSGPFYMTVADIPTPLGFFLGFFPVPSRHKSGVIVPTFGSSDRGFFLREGGYYLAVNDYVGIKLLGDAYANGSYRTSLFGDYTKKYSFRGNFSFNLSQIKEGFEENQGFSRDINVRWTHATHKKGSGSLTANVNAGSSTFYKRNSYNPTTFQQGVFNSSVVYYKAFRQIPFTLNMTLRHDQNVNTRVMNFTLPDITLASNRIYPFKSRNAVARKWYQNTYFNYTFDTRLTLTNDSVKLNLDTTYSFNRENLPFLLKKADYGARHSIPIGTTVKFKKTFLKYFNFNPVVNYQEFWNPYQLNYTWNTSDSTLSIDTTRGFFRSYSYSGNIAMSTTIYGMYKFKSKKLLGVRHTAIPTISYTYRPDFTSGNFQDVQIDEFGNRAELSRYRGSVYGGPTQGVISSLSFSLNNMFEAKVASKKDTVTGTRKFKLIDQLAVSGGYNFAAEQFKLSIINASARIRLFNKIDVFGSASLDPYAVLDSVGSIAGYNDTIRYFFRSNTFAAREGQGLFRLTNYNISISGNFNPNVKKPYRSDKGSEAELRHINNYSFMYVDFNIPWSLYVSYNLNYSRPLSSESIITQSFSFSGDLKLTEKWKVGFSSGYDFIRKELTLTRFDVYRDLHCWQMSINIVPFGPIRSYAFTFTAKSSILQDLKLNKRSSGFYGEFN